MGIDDYQKLSSNEVINELKSDIENGLTEEETKKRIDEYGLNEIPDKEESFFHRIFRRFWGPIPWMIEVAAIEELAGIDILCSDKTGTLTKNKMTTADPILFGKFTADNLMLYAALASKEGNHDPIEV